MVNDQKSGNSFENLSSYQSRVEKGKNLMEMEGRVYSDFYRNTSEELFMKSLMEGSIGIPAQNIEMLGSKNLFQNFRNDSEELFKSWLTSGENPGCNSNGHPRTRQASRMMSTELTTPSNQHQGSLIYGTRANESLSQQNTSVADDTQHLLTKNVDERGLQANNLYLAKAWFNSSQPMTRSRSSELRKRYTAMQSSQSILGPTHDPPEHISSHLKPEFVNPNGFNNDPNSIYEIPNQFNNTFMSPSNSSSSTFNNPQIDRTDKVSSVVSMLKGTLERKKLNSNNAIQGSNSVGYFNNAQGQANFHDLSTVQIEEHGVVQVVDGSVNIDFSGYMGNNMINAVQMNNNINNFSREPSQSESSAAAHVVSTGFEACNGPSNSGQTLSVCESSRKYLANDKNSDYGSIAKDTKGRVYDRKDDSKQKGSLVRYGSITSTGSVDKGDPTKKRRVERSRKMAEAKERTLIPLIPSDTQSVLKRCENLEKEVRSLKLNLAFMNRKDSEQTTQIEELQKQNEELTDEKERLLEEIERIVTETSKM